jgi:replication fork protection complex subunit Tof1/Swi1
MFTFEAFEMAGLFKSRQTELTDGHPQRFAQSEVTEALLHYLMRYQQYSGSDKLKRVVSLMHRQAVKAKAEGLFFQVSTLDRFNTLLSERSSFPKEQPYKDLVSLIRYILRQFFKRLEEDSFLATEVSFMPAVPIILFGHQV